jgi:hypothetical protein
MNKKTPPKETPKAVVDRLEQALNSDGFLSLASRWEDEKLYEDIAEYAEAFGKWNPDLKVLRPTKQPFGFVVAHGEMPGTEYHLYVEGDEVGWTRIAG